MAINRYDVPAQDNYFNTFVQLPYAELMNTVQARQAQVDQAQAQMDQAYEQSQLLKYIPNSEDEKKIRETQAFMSDWAQKYMGQDMSDPIIRRQAMHEYRSKLNRPLIQDIQESHSAWAKNQEVKRKYQAEGKYNELLDEDPATGYSTERNSIYGHMTPAQLDVRPAAEQYFNNLKDSLIYDANGNPLKDADGYNIIGVNRGDISRVVNERWRDFADTAEGRQSILLYARRNGIDPKALKPEQIKEIARQTLMDVGEEYIRTDITGSRTPEWAAKGSGSDDERLGYTTMDQTVRDDDKFDPMGLGKMSFGENGELYEIPFHSSYRPTPGGGAYKVETTPQQLARSQKMKQENQLKLQQVREQIPALANLNDKDTYTAYRELIKDGKAFPDLPKIDGLTDTARTGFANYLASTLLDRNMMVRDDLGSSELSKITEDGRGSVLSDLGWSYDDFRTALMEFASGKSSGVTVSSLSQNGPEAGMLMLEVNDKSRKGGGKGKPRKVLVTLNNEITSIMSPLNEVYDNVRNFKEGLVPIGYDQATGRQAAVQTIPKPAKNEQTGKWEYNYELRQGWIDESGQFVPIMDERGNPLKTTMQQLEKYQMKELERKNIVNSNITATTPTKGGY